MTPRDEAWRTPDKWVWRWHDPLDEHDASPKVSELGLDWSTAIFRLQRLSCFGPCPVYQVSIYPDGHVEYEGEAYVRACGKHARSIPRERVVRLARAFEAAHYLSRDLMGELPLVTCGDTAVTQLEVSGRHRTMIQYLPGMRPGPLTDLEKLIDALAETARWTGPVADYGSCPGPDLEREWLEQQNANEDATNPPP